MKIQNLLNQITIFDDIQNFKMAKDIFSHGQNFSYSAQLI